MALLPAAAAPRSPGRSGFTLTELIVSITIVGLLAGIALPAVLYVRNTANKTQCSSNLRQIGLAFEMYLDRHKDRYPKAARLPSLTPDEPRLSDLLAPYLEKNAAVFKCPADETYFPREGTSYEYPALRLEGKTRKEVLKRNGQEVTSLQYVWVLYDYEAFHGGKSGGRNFLHADGHVESF